MAARDDGYRETEIRLDREIDEETEMANIRADIRQTRERMGHTVEDIGERLNPDRLKTQLKHNLKDATIGKAEHMAREAAHRVDDTRHSIMDTIRDNPIPSAMVGIGLGWLLVNGRRHEYDYEGRWSAGYGGTERFYRTMPEERDWGYEGAAADEISVDGRTSGEGITERAKDRVTEIAHDARDSFENLTDRAQERLEEKTSRARSKADHWARETRHGTERVEERFEHALHDSPLAVGAAAAALGLAIGLTAPSTRRESELMGSKRDEMLNRAKHASRDASEKVREVAERVTDEAQATAKEAARDQDLI